MSAKCIHVEELYQELAKRNLQNKSIIEGFIRMANKRKGRLTTQPELQECPQEAVFCLNSPKLLPKPRTRTIYAENSHQTVYSRVKAYLAIDRSIAIPPCSGKIEVLRKNRHYSRESRENQPSLKKSVQKSNEGRLVPTRTPLHLKNIVFQQNIEKLPKQGSCKRIESNKRKTCLAYFPVLSPETNLQISLQRPCQNQKPNKLYELVCLK